MSKVPKKASEAGPLVPSVIRETRNHLSVCLSSALIKEVVITSLVQDLNHYSKSLIQHILFQEGVLTPKTQVFLPLLHKDAVKPQLFRAWQSELCFKPCL